MSELKIASTQSQSLSYDCRQYKERELRLPFFLSVICVAVQAMPVMKQIFTVQI